MLEQIARIMNPLRPLRARKTPWLAFVLGFLFSGIALGIYFRSWVDLVVPPRYLVGADRHSGRRGILGWCSDRRALGPLEGRQLQREVGGGKGTMSDRRKAKLSRRKEGA